MIIIYENHLQPVMHWLKRRFHSAADTLSDASQTNNNSLHLNLFQAHITLY